MRLRLLKTMTYATAVVSLLWLLRAEAKDRETLPDTSEQLSKINITVSDDRVHANGELFYLPTYETSGNTAGGIQNQVINSILDISNIPVARDGLVPAIGIQISDNGSVMHSVHLRRRKYVSALVDGNGIVYPDCKKVSDDGGPYVSIIFINDNDHIISLNSIKIDVVSHSRSKYETAREANDIFVVKKVTVVEPLTLVVIGKTSDKKWETTLYPTHRGATVEPCSIRMLKNSFWVLRLNDVMYNRSHQSLQMKG